MSMIERVKNILLQPKKEWPVIDRETTDTASLYTGYVMLLAAIGPVAGAIGMSMFGIMGMRLSLGAALVHAVVSYGLALAMVYVMALIINALAPTFAGKQNLNQALKVTAYSMTAAWVVGIFSLIPMLGILGLLGALYSLYLLYLGLPVLMKAPPEKALAYTIVVIVCGIVISIVIGWISSLMLAGSMPQPVMPQINIR
ncbi:MAG: hypothetical protein A2150_04730 [Candidatus Muproteobacteria bacterium RBG_16_64_11]|uniref:Yip1 domain-containing protein n=1 Tax=Candidatus Muproteobacteria bacterium RBG_16_64_11 TaxID=1817758 RepID=A0A1F6TB96_9PROT|nr:MAG: hypothetical protein A2150_04730 [Candidatus Muproteobacteria bacterium RBG_16_64_11]